MIWVYPHTFWGILLVGLILCVTFFSGRRSQKILQNMGKNSIEWCIRMSLRDGSMVLFMIFILLAAAEPRSGRQVVRDKRTGLDVAVAFDVSRSMLAEDLHPSRLRRGIAALGQIIRKIDHARFSIVPFRGNAFPLMPMTEDRTILELWMHRLSPGLLTAPGTDIEKALNVALGTFPVGSGRNPIMIVISDGEALKGRSDRSIKALGEKGIPVHIILSGTANGAPIPLGDGNFVLDSAGNPVVSKSNEKILERIAKGTGGTVHHLHRPDAVTELINVIEQDRDLVENRGISFAGVYRYRIFLIPALIMLFLFLLARIVPWRQKA